MIELLSKPGTYALIMRPECKRCVQIGKLGAIQLQTGTYVYVGSAFGPGGLAARVQRHLSGGGKVHWHVDYLLRWVKVHEVWLTYDPVKREEAWAKWFTVASGQSFPLRGFGSSDCGCDGHLFYFKADPAFDMFTDWALEVRDPGAPSEVLRVPIG